jgi:hypothetical protein
LICAKGVIVGAAHDAVRVRTHEDVRELRRDQVDVEGVRALLVPGEELVNALHAIPSLSL